VIRDSSIEPKDDKDQSDNCFQSHHSNDDWTTATELCHNSGSRCKRLSIGQVGRYHGRFPALMEHLKTLRSLISSRQQSSTMPLDGPMIGELMTKS
jgi:hypothetical protein